MLNIVMIIIHRDKHRYHRDEHRNDHAKNRDDHDKSDDPTDFKNYLLYMFELKISNKI